MNVGTVYKVSVGNVSDLTRTCYPKYHPTYAHGILCE